MSDDSQEQGKQQEKKPKRTLGQSLMLFVVWPAVFMFIMAVIRVFG